MPRLAKLSDLKLQLGSTQSGQDELLLSLLARATATAERLVGRSLCRQADMVEYPTSGTVDRVQRRYVRLRVAPIESITTIKQLYAPGSDAEFAAQAALTVVTDYVVCEPGIGQADNLGVLERINAAWYLGPRCLQVVYTAGFVDPGDEDPPDDAIQPPEDLQQGIVMEALRLKRGAMGAGLKSVAAGQGGGGDVSTDPHPELVAVCARLRRLSV